MGYSQYTLSLAEDMDSTILTAFLELEGVDSIWEEESQMKAYFTDEIVNAFVGNFLEHLKEVCGAYITDIQFSKPEEINWNAEWERNFPTVEVDDFVYIYADFHAKKPDFEHYIKIAPKMAFGTGHHETTFMMIQAMRELELEAKTILDLGCGTGILAVLAAQKNAASVDAIDIELPSYENTIEHADINNVEINVYHGGVDDVPNKKYDVILANINRHVLLTFTDVIIEKLEKGSVLVLSGILQEDRAIIEKAYGELTLSKVNSRGNWLCFQYVKP